MRLLCAVLLSSSVLALSITSRGFATNPSVLPSPPGLTISGSAASPGLVKCLIAPLDLTVAGISTLLENATAFATLSAAGFWSDTAAFPGSRVAYANLTDGTVSFEFKLGDFDAGSLQMVSCGFSSESEHLKPVLGAPGITLVGTPDTDCARALNPLTQGNFPDFPWSKMQKYSSKYVLVNDIGTYDNCLSQPNTTYCSVKGGLAGYCLPDLCNPDDAKAAKVSAVKQGFALEASLLLALRSGLLESSEFTQGGPLEAVISKLSDSVQTQVETVAVISGSAFYCAGQSPSFPLVGWLWAGPLMLLLAMCLGCTGLDIMLLQPKIIQKRTPVAGWEWLATQFSLLTSWSSLVEHRPGNLQFFDGLRFFACTWVVLGHMEVELFNPATGTANIMDMFPHNNGNQAESKQWWWQLIPGGFFAVDTFFWVAGFFATFVMLRKAARIQSILGFGTGIPLMLFGRWLRLVPSLLAALGAYWVLLPSLGDGPAWGFDEPINPGCTDNWWREILFITSWGPQAPLNGAKSWGTCMGITWYLTCDFFYYALSPLVIMIHMWDYRAAATVATALLAACVTANIVYADHHGESASTFVNFTDQEARNAWSSTYFSPWLRASPYLIGMLYAMRYNSVTQHSKQSGVPHRLSWWHSLGVQLLGVGLLCYCLFGTLGEIQSQQCSSLAGFAVQPFDPPDCEQFESAPQWTSDFYNGFSRVLFGVALSCLAEAWIWGGDYNFARWLLSLPVMAPLGKLSFNAYLWHYLIKDWYYGEMRNVAYYTRLSQLVWWLGVVYIAFAVALIVFLFVEEPFAKLSTALLQGLETELKRMLKPPVKAASSAVPELEEHLSPSHCPSPLKDTEQEEKQREVSQLSDELWRRSSI